MSENPLKPLNDGQVEGVAGGYLFYVEGELETPWEVIDNRGNVVRRCKDRGEAYLFAKENGYGVEELYWSQLKKLRETGEL